MASPHSLCHPFLFTPFIIGLVAGIKINLFGQLFLGEPLAIIYLVVRIQGARVSTRERWFFVLAVIWSIAQILSDIINETPPIDSAKGALAPVVFASTTLGLILYFRQNITRIASFLLGVTLAACVNLFTQPSDYFLSINQWKWGIGIIALWIFLIYYSFFRTKESLPVLFLGLFLLSFISILNNARSLAMLPLLAGSTYAILKSRRVSFFVAQSFGGKFGAAKAFIALIPLLLLLNWSFSQLASSDFPRYFLPEDVAQKYQRQASNPYGILLGARSEILISSRAFIDKPLLGHGSWATDDGTYINDYLFFRYRYGFDDNLRPVKSYAKDLIPAHSFLMGSLVWAGVLGGLFWLYALTFLADTFFKNFAYLPVFYYVGAIFLAWDIFFSPFAAITRWSSALVFGALFAYVYEYQGLKRKVS